MTESHHPPTVDRGLRFFVLRAKARPETMTFAEQARKMRAQLREKREAVIEITDERIAIGAEITYLDTRIDRLVLVALKREVGTITAPMSKSDAATYERKLWQGVAPSVGMRPVANDDQKHYVSGIIQRLETDGEYAPLGDHAARLRKEQKGIDAAVARRKDTRVREALARADLDATTDEARRFYNQLYPQLQLIFPDDPALVESCFLDLRGTAAYGDGEDAGGGEDSGGGQPPTS